MKKSLIIVLPVLLFCLIQPVSALTLEDGDYCVAVDLTGGSGKAGITTPTLMTVQDGVAYALLTWSSSNYDYMIVEGVRYDNESEPGMNSSFTIPIPAWDEPVAVIADTTAMGHPVEVHYQLFFYGESVGDRAQLPQEAAKRVLIMACVIIVAGGILNHFVKKRYEY